MSAADMDMIRVEAENRMRNLAWTVGENYEMPVEPDVDLYLRSPERGLYRAVCEGGFFHFLDRQAFSLYLLKKMYFGADEGELSRISLLCMDAAVHGILEQFRPGVPGMRRRAAEAFLEAEFDRSVAYPLGRLQLAWFGEAAGRSAMPDRQIREGIEWLRRLEEAPAPDTELVTRAADAIYNLLVDPGFEQKYGGWEKVQAVTLSELSEADFDWTDFLKEEAETQTVEELPETGGEPEGSEKGRTRNHSVIQLDENARSKAYAYMELNYGRSYMKELDRKRLNYTLCRDVHDGCSLYFTEGILHNLVKKNYQSEYVRRQHEYNKTQYNRSRFMANRNIAILSEMLRQSLIRREEQDRVRSETGRILPRQLWKVGRTDEKRLFEKIIRGDQSEFVVDILMDASGSQRDRRGDVAVQAFIISEALSIAGIPHRVQSFCTCWDYTILQRFREYDAPREENRKVFEYSTSANNRDGLAIRTVVHTLLQRPEENRILIILSDGRPNDRIVNKTVSRAPVEYVGDFAVYDTAEEVRKARNAGIAVLGVFAGEEEDLAAEKKIFGRDFAYIRTIQNFSHIVGRYLRRQMDQTW